MNKIIFKILILLHRLVKGIANRVLDKKTIRPRDFSNAMLKKYAHHFSGSVINVSGWMDEDGQGSHYKKYFTKHTSYTVSNVRGQGKGFGSASLAGYQEIELDLLKDLPVSLEKKFDVVFNHTTLEHIYEFKKAFNNICALSNDAVIIVVPVMQQIHHTKDFGDYWRPTTMTIAKLFKDNGFKPVIIECNEQPFAPIYCFAIALRDKSKHPTLTPHINFQMGAYNYGSP
ncbi:hypothetical protein KW807_00450, partial [Candidatus Parcubacteria bacterium]|nr:hypothetical protein [Candidatus Parcubacteria bacterium]